MPVLIDTNVAIDLLNRPAEARSRPLASEPLLISAVSVVELQAGVTLRPEQADYRRAALAALLEGLTVLSFDVSMAERYGAIVAEAGFSRRKVLDRMIAATALVTGSTLVTANPADFSDVPGLRLEAW